MGFAGGLFFKKYDLNFSEFDVKFVIATYLERACALRFGNSIVRDLTFRQNEGGVSSICAGVTLDQSLSEIANVSLLLIEEWCAATSRRTAHLPAFK